jgi:hypothetical protein
MCMLTDCFESEGDVKKSFLSWVFPLKKEAIIWENN